MTLILRNKNLLKKKLFCLKKRRNIKQTEKSIIKMEHYKISKLLNDSTVCTKKIGQRKWFIKWRKI